MESRDQDCPESQESRIEVFDSNTKEFATSEGLTISMRHFAITIFDHTCCHNLRKFLSSPAQVRLVNGTGACEGTVEVYSEGRWGTVCSNMWDIPDAEVVCKELGCGSAVSAPQSNTQVGAFLLNNVRCRGNEPHLWQCESDRWDREDCKSESDALVVCSESVSGKQGLSAEEDDLELRLVESASPCYGVVEVYYRGVWGSVCSQSWDLKDAAVVCKQLGCGEPEAAPSSTREATWQRITEEVNALGYCHCQVAEVKHKWRDLRKAVKRKMAQIVQAVEATKGRHPPPLLMLLEDIISRHISMLQVRGLKFPSDTNVRKYNAKEEGTQHQGGATFGEGAGPIWGDRVDCRGNESILWECPFTPQGPQNCTHKNNAAVICSGRGGPRLVDGESRCSGRVEILHGNTWGSVCDQYLDLEDANVICEHLSCGVAVSTPRGAHFGKGDGRMWRDGFHCRGNESRLWECPTTWDQQSCGDNNTAGVICSGEAGENWQVRLSNGGSRCDGRLEVFYNGTWGRVLDDSWDPNDADVACRQLDCGSALQAYNSSQYGHGAGPVWLTRVECLGNESALHHCNRFPTGHSDASDDVGLLCSEHLKLRLVGRGGHCSGRVEVYYNGSWGTVCDDQWDLSDAEVVCKQLGCGHAITATTLAVFGEGRGPVWLDDMQCRGNESLLWECPLVEWGRHNCKHREDAGVVCSEFKELKLVSDRHDCAGRVEVFYNGTWGSVCSNNMRDVTIRVICQQMGCGNTGTLDKQFGEEGSGPKWLDGINCLGYESVLWQCRSLPWGQNKCIQGEVAQIACQEHLEVRLAGGDSECSGRVEVQYNGSWGTVCDESWDLNAASVVCRQLDCGSAVAVVSDAGFGEGSGPVWLDEEHCRGSESLLIHCDLFGGFRDCGHKEDAGVVCSGSIVSTPTTVRYDAAGKLSSFNLFLQVRLLPLEQRHLLLEGAAKAEQ
ncbi:deleted in malignant brain tumors 1 protein-like [Latimeria chalumnae]|uniref:deleted in malignant brain tumors 1 protein-like n=1 Tax=Latimeria chalumnae TaxID=7897 RepID=UPI00313C7E52